MSDYPYGKCECDECRPGWCHGEGPAAFEVVRGDRKMRLCTKCTLSGDKDSRLLLTKSDDLAPFREWDPEEGITLIELLLQEKD